MAPILYLVIYLIAFIAVAAILNWFMQKVNAPEPVKIVVYAVLAIAAILTIMRYV